MTLGISRHLEMDQNPAELATPDVIVAAQAETEQPPIPVHSSMAPLVGLAGWAVPGLGHVLLRRWTRALAFFLAVVGLELLGYRMRGDVFPPRSIDPFGTLGFLADVGSGSFYLLSRVFESAGPDISRAMGDYGTRVIATAGLVNLLAAIDAYETAWRRRR
jgi:hypothetical protein